MAMTVDKATIADLAVVKNLVPYYIYDMSEHMGWACARDGRFDGCNGIETYWTEEGKHAYMLRVDEEWAGFAVVRGNHQEPDIDFSIAEFFVLRKFRGRGIGERVANQLFDRFRGRWMVEQLTDNKPAVAFWHKVIDRYCAGKFTEQIGSSDWGKMNVLRFANGDSTGS